MLFRSRYDIWRDGIRIDSVTHSEAIKGNVYEYIDYTARAGRTYAYNIGASQNDSASESASTTITKSSDFIGIWLVDPVSDLKIQIMGDDPGDWDMGEVSTTYQPVGATATRVVTQALRGYEGSLEGLLIGDEKKSIEVREAEMFSLKSPPGRTFMLVLADVAFPVVLSNIVVAPTPHKETVKEVSFKFYQQGTLPFRGAL